MKALFGVALLVLACGPSARPPEDPHPQKPEPSASNVVPEDPPRPDVTTPADPNEIVMRALRNVSQIRELSITGKVTGRSIGRDEMVARVKEQIHREIPDKMLFAQNELLFALGTVPGDFDYEKTTLELLGTQLAGFYDPKEKTMFLAKDLVGIERDATLAHELVHALQDQHYDLEKLIAFKEDAGDEQGAIHALAEGDATSAMFDHVLAAKGVKATALNDDLIALQVRSSMELSPETQSAPTIIKRSLIAPYIDGIVFVHWARRRGGWRAVDEIWKNPPTTTEQLLHPEKYLTHEPAEAIAIPVPPPSGPSEVMYRDIFGEESVDLLFEEWMPRHPAAEAASGWSGDRIAVFQDGKRYALAWHLRYDTEVLATRTVEAFARGVLRQKTDISKETAAKAAKSGSVCRARSDAGPFAVFRSGRDIALVAGPYDRSAGAPRSASSCANALKWAKSVATQR